MPFHCSRSHATSSTNCSRPGGHLTGGSSLATEGVVSSTPQAVGGSSSRPSVEARSTHTASCTSVSPAPPRASSSCGETVQRFARDLGLSCPVALRVALCHRSSSLRLYRHLWECYRRWCADHGHTVSSQSLSKFADFLYFLLTKKRLGLLD